MLHIKNLTVHIQPGPTALSRAFIDALMRGPESEPSTDTAATGPVHTPESIPAIGAAWHGGTYGGLSRGEDGQPDAHIILLDARPEKDVDWGEAVKWAESLGDGARLPTRFESALIYANLQDKVDKDRWHWTGTQSSSSGAWFQHFYGGTQGTGSKTSKARAVAVRRLIL